MTHEIKVSVICTNYNKGPWIADALDSVIGQKTDFPIEIIVVDDASTDGSRATIDDYAKRYPELIFPLYHEQNLGIAKTWIEACKKARGAYIARLDGDDWWTDENKLQKQVDLLAQNPDSLWSNTDFDLSEANGTVFCHNALANNSVPTAYCFEEMLARKALTNSSTWVIDAALAREVNESIDDQASDDTFDIQLELFSRTKLSTLNDSCAVYRLNQGSDSKPMTKEGAETRFRGIERAQLHYLEANKEADYKYIAKLLIQRDTNNDVRIFDYDMTIDTLNRAVAERDQRIAQLEHELDQILNSKRWKAAGRIAKIVGK